MSYGLLWIEMTLVAILAVSLVVRGMASPRIRAACATLPVIYLVACALEGLGRTPIGIYLESSLVVILLVVAAGWSLYWSGLCAGRWPFGLMVLALSLGIGLASMTILAKREMVTGIGLVGGVTAGVLAWSLRRSPWFTWPLSAPLWLLPLGGCVALVILTRYVAAHHGLVGLPIRALAIVAILAAAGQVVLIGLGWLRRGDDGRLAAASWPAGGLAAGFMLAVALVGATLWNIDQTVRTRMEALRVEASALASTAAPPRIPDSRNAAVVYQQAFDLANSVPEVSPGRAADDGERLRWWERVSQEAAEKPIALNASDPRLLQTMAHVQPVLTLLRRGAALPDCYFQRSWGTPSPSMIIDEVVKLRASCQWFLVDAVVKAKGGHTAEALEDVVALFRMAGHLRQEPIGVSMLVALEVDRRALQTLAAVLAVSKPTAVQLEAVSFDPSISYSWAFRRVVFFEQAIGLAMFQDAPLSAACLIVDPKGRLASKWSQDLGMVLYRLFLLEDDLRAYRESTSAWTSGMNPPVPYHLSAPPLPELSGCKSATGMPQGPHLLTDLLVQPYPAMWYVVGRGDATLHLARLTVALAAYRAKNGAYPQKLEQLVPGHVDHVPIDPFDAKPLKMLCSDQGLVLYSIGPNKKDDQGVTNADDWRHGDLVIRLVK